MSFKSTLIILTTNVGSSVIAKGGAGIGFELRGEAETAEQAKYSRVRGLVMEELKVKLEFGRGFVCLGVIVGNFGG